jgi:hypothetical protein
MPSIFAARSKFQTNKYSILSDAANAYLFLLTRRLSRVVWLTVLIARQSRFSLGVPSVHRFCRSQSYLSPSADLGTSVGIVALAPGEQTEGYAMKKLMIVALAVAMAGPAFAQGGGGGAGGGGAGAGASGSSGSSGSTGSGMSGGTGGTGMSGTSGTGTGSTGMGGTGGTGTGGTSGSGMGGTGSSGSR